MRLVVVQHSKRVGEGGRIGLLSGKIFGGPVEKERPSCKLSALMCYVLNIIIRSKYVGQKEEVAAVLFTKYPYSGHLGIATLHVHVSMYTMS